MAWEDVVRPTLDADTDAIVRVDATTICGTDLHILRGDLPAMVDGRIIGHEAVGTVVETGAAMVDIAHNHTPVESNDRPVATMTRPAAEGTPAGSTGMASPVPANPPPAPGQPPISTNARNGHPAPAVHYLVAAIRLALGWVFLWAFLDKAFGLGHDTTSAKAWIHGGSPTKGFLGSAAKGPFTGFYHSLAGTTFADVFFMIALAAIGTALILGIGMWLAATGGAVLTVMMWSAVLPPASNPFLDEHLIYAAVLILLACLGAGRTLGLGRPWATTPLVRRLPWLA
jgi:thiosulfate dehydrogenase [quinone] large subunit